MSRASRWRRACFFSLAASAGGFALRAESIVLEPMIVTASRTAQPAAAVPFSVTQLDGDRLRATPSSTLDGALRSVAGFSLFRRSDSLTANPTAQGVSLRGLGPSGASRSLVLLDGVPLTDAFGGWVLWSKVPRESLVGAEVIRGGGASVWGNAALGGVVQLLTAPPEGERTRLTALAGDFETRSVEAEFTRPAGPGTLQLLGRAFSTGGFRLVASERSGSIDTPAKSHHGWLTARWRQPVGETMEATLTARVFSERRGNGTPYQGNASRETFGSAELTGRTRAGFGWNALVYAQATDFSSTFSSVNAARTSETPASDQFAVPATTRGAAWTGTWAYSKKTRTTTGIDVRTVRGETRERFLFANGDFTRLREAGGTQASAGWFVLREQALSSALVASLGARIDGWQESDGHRRESDRSSGAASRDDRYADDQGLAFSPSAGLVWQTAAGWRWRVAAQHAFRRPTLNELYRPFRQGSTVVEANSVLRTERVISGEVGVDYTRGKLELGLAGFWNELRDAVSNVTLARGPGIFPLFGSLPTGGIGRQRLNLDRVLVRGIEATASWRIDDAFSVNATYLLDDARVRRAAVAPDLVGKRVAQVPRNSASVGATWRVLGGLVVTPRLRWLDRQFEDDENKLVLGEVTIVDLGLSYPLKPGAEIFITIENLAGARIETGRSAAGVVNTGQPRHAFGGMRWLW